MDQAIAAVACAAGGSMISSRAFDFAPGEQVAALVLPVFGTQRIGGGVIFNNVENFVGSTFPGRPVDRAPRYQSTCRQCGAPHEPRATGCEYCLTPKA